MRIQFEIADWINSHKGCYDLMQSGLTGRIDLSKYFNGCGFEEPKQLKKLIAQINGTDEELVSLTHGATEGVDLVAKALRLSGVNGFDNFLPEYEMLYKAPLAEGMERGKNVLFLSDPNNPTSLRAELPEGYRYYVIDETFLQFVADLDRVKRPLNSFRINTFTKFYGGDEVRVGYIIFPSSEIRETIERLQGITYEPVSKHNICIAKKILEDNDRLKEEARRISAENFETVERYMGELKFFMNRKPEATTIAFLDYSRYSSISSFELCERLYKKGISAIPAKMFGSESTHIRVAYTRENTKDAMSELVSALENLHKSS